MVALVIALALFFDFTNGFHDTANAMATPIATGAIKPKTAVTLAAILNLVGAFLSTEVAKTVSGGIIREGSDGVQITPDIIFAGLMGAIKAFTLWFPLSRIASLNGLYLAVGGMGGLAATAPAEALVGPFGWRALFFGLAALSLLVASLVFFVVPERPLPGKRQTLGAQFAAFRIIFGNVRFWRLVLPFVVCHSGYLTLQGLWLGPWLYDVAGQDRASVGNYLFTTAVAYTVGSMFICVASDRVAAAGLSRLAMMKIGMTTSVAIFILLAAGMTRALGPLLFVSGFTTIASSLAYALLTTAFATEMTGRVSTACNVLMFTIAFFSQWGVGAVLKLYPVTDGSYSPEGYGMALGILAALQCATLAWLLPMREKAD